MEASEILIGSRAAIVERDWCKHALEDDDGRVCSFGALNLAAFGDPNHLINISMGERESHPNYVNYHKAAAFFGHVVGRPVTQWNNAPERTFSDVIDAFDESILVAKQREAEVA